MDQLCSEKSERFSNYNNFDLTKTENLIGRDRQQYNQQLDRKKRRPKVLHSPVLVPKQEVDLKQPRELQHASV